MYDLIKPWLFKLSAEQAHDLSLDALSALSRLGLSHWVSRKIPETPTQVMGLHFKNPIGLAAGLDKNADYVTALGQLGFGFIEVGTVTPKPQPGNLKPRLFRIPEHQSIINRMGFNNKGVDHMVCQLSKRRYSGILGVNIGKNRDTPNDEALNDYLFCMERLYALADYLCVNLSSPNTPGLRSLQQGDAFTKILEGLKVKQLQLEPLHGKYTPLVVKVSPNLSEDELQWMAEQLMRFEWDAVIATNTSTGRDGVQHHPIAAETGGLSGAPLFDQAQHTTQALKRAVADKIPIIGVGGILSGHQATVRMQAGADLIQLYSGLVFKGPKLLSEVADALISTQAENTQRSHTVTANNRKEPA